MKKILVAGIICAAGLLGCQSDMAAFEKGNPEAGNKVLFAGASSRFKNAVVEKVLEELGKESYYCRGIGISLLEQTDLTQFDAVVIVCAIQGGKIEERARNYFSNDPTNGKLIGFYTAGLGIDESGKPEMGTPDVHIDAVTSASEMKKAGQKAKELAALIKKKCEGL